MPGPRWPERTPGDGRHAFLGEQPLCERLVVEPGRCDPGKGVERTARLGRVETELAQRGHGGYHGGPYHGHYHGGYYGHYRYPSIGSAPAGGVNCCQYPPGPEPGT